MTRRHGSAASARRAPAPADANADDEPDAAEEVTRVLSTGGGAGPTAGRGSREGAVVARSPRPHRTRLDAALNQHRRARGAGRDGEAEDCATAPPGGGANQLFQPAGDRRPRAPPGTPERVTGAEVRVRRLQPDPVVPCARSAAARHPHALHSRELGRRRHGVLATPATVRGVVRRRPDVRRRRRASRPARLPHTTLLNGAGARRPADDRRPPGPR